MIPGLSSIAEHLASWWARLRRPSFSPVPVTIEVTRHCQQSCHYCYRLPESAGFPEFLETELLKTILDRLTRHFGRLVITLSGGKPTLHPTLPELIRLCRDLTDSVLLISHLSSLTPTLANDLYQVGLRQIQTTFVSPIPAEHEALCGSGTFSSWLNGIKAARDAQLQIGAILLVTPGNLERLPLSIDFLLSLGISGWMVNRYNAGYPSPTTDKSLFLSQSDLYRMLSLLEETATRRHLKIPLGIPIPPCLVDPARYPHLEFSHCPMGKPVGQYWAVGTSAHLRPCNHLPLPLGDLRTQTIAEILAGPSWQQIQKVLQSPPPVCIQCHHFPHCQGGCRAAAQTWCGDFSRCDPWVERVLLERQKPQI